mmetsp:Transcript_14094/g.22464  ORF Transcript_14094/g.22464 Transcript_14094/m.22464 type:complete len:283 (-) Transcript_14094:290-1138(-)
MQPSFPLFPLAIVISILCPETCILGAKGHGMVVKRVNNKNLPYSNFRTSCKENKLNFRDCDGLLYTPWQINKQSQVLQVKKRFKNPSMERGIWPMQTKSAKYQSFEDAWRKKGWIWTKREDRRLPTPSKICGYTIPPKKWEPIPNKDTVDVMLKYGHGGYQEFRLNGEKIDPIRVTAKTKKGEFVPFWHLRAGGLNGNFNSEMFLNKFVFPDGTFNKCRNKGCRLEWHWLKTYDNTKNGRVRYRSELYQNCIWIHGNRKGKDITKSEKEKQSELFDLSPKGY